MNKEGRKKGGRKGGGVRQNMQKLINGGDYYLELQSNTGWLFDSQLLETLFSGDAYFQ